VYNTHDTINVDNIDSVMNCMTRVRIKVLDENKVDDQELRHIDGGDCVVLGHLV
jgi:phosphotransferase system IIB component